MKITHHNTDVVDIVELEGELVMASGPELRKQLQAIINAGSGNLILQLEKVSFVDSRGLSVFVSALKHAREKQGQVVLVALMPEVRSLLELTRLHKVFDIFEDTNSALAHFKQ